MDMEYLQHGCNTSHHENVHLFAQSTEADGERKGNQTANVCVLVNLEGVMSVPSPMIFSFCQPKRRRGQN